MESISVHYKLSEKEYLAAAWLLTFRSGMPFFRMAVSFILFAVGLLLLLLNFGFDERMILIICAALLTALTYYYHLIFVGLPRRFYRGDRKFRDAVTLTFTAENILAQTKEIESKISWKLYTDVLEDDSCYVLVYGKDIRMMTAIPKRVFKSKKSEAAFSELLAGRFAGRLGARQIDNDEVIENEYEPASLE
ncbi:MAG: YcxB family protein, partial [Acidobacteriota bacterium]|nr:YcxB family protein [Acidobacteriota bacterium]